MKSFLPCVFVLGVAALIWRLPPPFQPSADDMLVMGAQLQDQAWIESAGSAGADVNATDAGDRTALMWAAMSGDEATVRRLLEAGADPSLRCCVDVSALGYAACHGRTAVLEALLDAGADIEQTGSIGGTALHMAAAMCEVESVRVLLDRGARVDALNSRGETPLMLAAARGAAARPVMNLLLERGAAPDLRDAEGVDASSRALEAGDPAAAALLEDAIASTRRSGIASLTAGEPVARAECDVEP